MSALLNASPGDGHFGKVQELKHEMDNLKENCDKLFNNNIKSNKNIDLPVLERSALRVNAMVYSLNPEGSSLWDITNIDQLIQCLQDFSRLIGNAIDLISSNSGIFPEIKFSKLISESIAIEREVYSNVAKLLPANIIVNRNKENNQDDYILALEMESRITLDKINHEKKSIDEARQSRQVIEADIASLSEEIKHYKSLAGGLEAEMKKNYEEKIKDIAESLKQKVNISAVKDHWIKLRTSSGWSILGFALASVLMCAATIYMAIWYSDYAPEDYKASDYVTGFLVLFPWLWLMRMCFKAWSVNISTWYESRERVAMIDSYISLIAEDGALTNEAKTHIIQTIFRPTLHGFGKEFMPTTPASIMLRRMQDK